MQKFLLFVYIGATNWKKPPEVPTISQKRSSLDVNIIGSSRPQRQMIIPDIRTEQVGNDYGF